jgi:hypothetical protein
MFGVVGFQPEWTLPALCATPARRNLWSTVSGPARDPNKLWAYTNQLLHLAPNNSRPILISYYTLAMLPACNNGRYRTGVRPSSWTKLLDASRVSKDSGYSSMVSHSEPFGFLETTSSSTMRHDPIITSPSSFEKASASTPGRLGPNATLRSVRLPSPRKNFSVDLMLNGVFRLLSALARNSESPRTDPARLWVYGSRLAHSFGCPWSLVAVQSGHWLPSGARLTSSCRYRNFQSQHLFKLTWKCSHEAELCMPLS